ncbi:hypothetical protein [Bacteroides sp. 519]|uniref:hypothetical protein n=1 Tax=Bacteroides sp. 519 TaxID=2302937 RepID=UPI0013D2E3DF|nr:hypothetical protein [Bacteroides sp. 519]NDV60403.1 hypothetical protein [Bacteroides sp. 519]
MEHIKKIVDFIDRNYTKIELCNQDIYSQCPFSKAKIDKDFKAYTGTTIRKYLVDKQSAYLYKLLRSGKYKNISELERDIPDYKYTLRTLRNQLKAHKQEMQIEDDDIAFRRYVLFLRNQSIFAEILIRFILHNELAKLKMQTTNCIIEHNVKDTIFQFNNIIPFEKSHIYRIFIDVADLSFEFMHIGYVNEFEELFGYVPTSINVYFSYIYTLQKKLEKYINFSFTDTIRNWDKYIKSTKHTTFLTEFYQLETINDGEFELEINKESDFIKATDYLIEDLRNIFFRRIEKKILELFGTSYNFIQDYIKAVEKNDYTEMASYLNKIKKWNEKKISLFLKLSEYAFLDNMMIDNTSLSHEFSELCYQPKEKIIDCIIEQRKKILKDI